jgi:phosphatidylinositol alpha-1,6-mannosyltransferase
VSNLLPGRPPHVATVHGGDIFGLRPLARVKRWTLTHADAVTVNSSFTRAAVLSVAPTIARISHIPMGVDTDVVPSEIAVAELRARYRRGTGPLVGFLGRLIEEKGVFDLIEAANRLRSRLPDLTVVVAGEGPHRAEAERMCRDLGLEDRVFFIGWVARPEVPNLLAALDLFVAPSKTAPDGWMEAQGLSVIEAMAVGTAVIASRHGGLVDSIEDGESGLLIAENDPPALASAIELLARDQSLTDQLGCAGRKRAVERFSHTATARKFDDLFRGLIAVNPR